MHPDQHSVGPQISESKQVGVVTFLLAWGRTLVVLPVDLGGDVQIFIEGNPKSCLRKEDKIFLVLYALQACVGEEVLEGFWQDK
jgi:hypothetical protein